MKEALLIGASAANEAGVGLRRAAEDAEDDAFRRETMERAGFSPRIVGVLLGRSRRENLRAVAGLALRALAPETSTERREATYAIGVFFTGSVAITIGLTMLGGAGGALGLSRLVALGAVSLASLGVVLSALTLQRRWLSGWTLRARLLFFGALVFPPLLLFVLPAALRGGSAAPLDTRRILLWLAAGEVVGLVPGAVIAALRASDSPTELWLLGRIEARIRGATSAKEAVVLWSRGERSSGDRTWRLGRGSGLFASRRDPSLLAECQLEGDSAPGAIERIARMLALSGDRATHGSVAAHGAFLAVVFATYLLVSQVVFSILALGGIP